VLKLIEDTLAHTGQFTPEQANQIVSTAVQHALQIQQQAQGAGQAQPAANGQPAPA
jgi:hypothetical protein